MSLLNIPLFSRIILCILMSVPSSVLFSFLIIDFFKWKESAWPKTLVRSSMILGVVCFLLL
jgi:hypothetical protein